MDTLTDNQTVERKASIENCETLIQSVRSSSVQLNNSVTSAAVAVVRHVMTYHEGSLAAKLKNILDEYGPKKSGAAFGKLCFEHTGVSIADGKSTINAERQEKAKGTYAQAIEQVQNLGLLNWYSEQSGGGKPAKTEAEKAKARADKQAKAAKEWLANQSTGSGVEAFKAKAMLELGEQFAKLYEQNANMAEDMLQKEKARLVKGIADALANNISSLKPEATEQAA